MLDKMFCVVFCVFAVVCIPGVFGDLAQEMAEVTQLCCNQGTQYARNHTAEDCSSSVLPDVQPVFGSICIFAMDQCCREYFTKKDDCETGINSAGGVCSDTNAVTRDCCKECQRGKADAASGSCASSASGTSAVTLLSNDAYTHCCQKALTEKSRKDTRPVEHTEHSTRPILSILPSLCEEYAPNELCAHHCIPVPGSYKCECNPGFMLMPDGRNCKEVTKNRCKPHNPCEYKCNDNGIEVKCSCKRGYELMADGKSCQDIDECILDTPVCLPGTQCLNMKGSYRCVPNKNSNQSPAEKGQCPPGFARNIANNACDDINECLLPHPPCPTYLCENTIGGYKCGGVTGDPANLPSDRPPVEDRCPPGFRTGLNESCEDVDECAINKDDCNRLSQFCINTLGSFYCQDKVSKHCPPGFKIDKRTNKCGDINECEDSDDICRPDQICVNELGQYDCKAKVDPSRVGFDCPIGMRLKQGSSMCEDIDECVEGTHMCDQYHYCLNTNGSHECHCKLGFEKDPITGACTDINECATGQHDCIATQRCDNTVGSFLCIRFTSCGTGYILHHSTGKCEDVDECALGIHNCARAGPEYHCVNHPGSFRCVRKRASTTSTTPQPIYEYYYDSEEEIEGTEDNETNPGASNSSAANPAPKPETPSRPPQPSEIPPPLPELPPKPEVPEIPDDRINEIAPPEPTEPTNTYVATPIYNPEPSPVEPEPRTVPIPQEPEPTEPPTETQTVTEQERSRPSEPERPNPTYSPYEPNRPPPTYKPYQPEETKPTYPPYRPDDPKPTYPPYQPEEPKYEPSPNINESVQPEPTEPGLETTYRPEPSSSSSATPPSLVYVQVGEETATVRGVKKEDGSVVINTKDIPKDEWTKVKDKPSNCQLGFQLDEYGACYDIDECATDRHTCSPSTEVCKNTMGGYLCDCATGYRRDLFTGLCGLIPTTTSSTTSTTTLPPPTTTEKPRIFWGYPEYRPRTVRPFRRRNWCDAGFHLDSNTGKCEDVNECVNGQANCASEEVCVNTDGGYRCVCLPKWHLDEVKHRCVPDREEGRLPSVYGNEPVYTPIEPQVPFENEPSFGVGGGVEPDITKLDDHGSVIRCPRGYRLGDDNICEDIDECSTGEASCGPMQRCVNLPGGYICNCPVGHRLVDDHECEDVDECKAAGNLPICSQNADCINTVGSYQCRCHTGFRSAPVNDKVCVDVDECTESRAGSLCEQRCNNVWGGYRCSCHRGYRLNSDNKTCSDVNECEEFKSKVLCVGRCVNEPGSYRCSCPSGYRLSEDKRSCIDIDECETGEAPCASAGSWAGSGANDVCLNTRGSYRCHRIVCPPGYQLESKNRCTKVERVCPPADWECAHQPSTYSYNFITFVSNLYIPASKVDLFTMRGPTWSHAQIQFQLRLVDVNAPPSVKRKADINSFLLTQAGHQGVVSLVRPLEGPQSIELELLMELYNYEQFGGIAVAKIFIFVSEYEF